ncbi:MAG TPA: phosphatidylglycerol lysyltransferase domain-containing protein [Clostridia bacterium]|nr:phosphatidylglycerol lysyltransferase domain-containing protein [Clostridia bacterium]
MDIFHRPKIEDKEWVDNIIYKANRYGCEYTFGNILMWSVVFYTRIAIIEDMFVSCTSDEGADVCTFCFPIGEGDLKGAVTKLLNMTKEKGHSLEFFGLTAEDVTVLDKLFPNSFDFKQYRNGFDYIYLSDDLINLKGKKYSSKRNHINAFNKRNEWSYETINETNIEECKKMHKKWMELNKDKNPKDIENEFKVIKLGFEHYDELGLVGGLIRVDGDVVAFTMGEKLNDETFCTHFEKAFAEMRGAYPVINREFAHNALQDYKYINREEDTGSEGLRKAKLSYHPEILLEKYKAFYRG